MNNLQNILSSFRKVTLIIAFIIIQSCSTIESTWDSVSDSVSEAGDYFYDSVIFWGDDEDPVESEVMIIEEIAEVPDFKPIENNQNIQLDSSRNQPSEIFLGNPVYKSARQYYFVSPNGSPMPAPPPPPFPQYSIENQSRFYSSEPSRKYGYESLNTVPKFDNQNFEFDNNQINENLINDRSILSYEEEMELYGIENSCIRVIEDYMNGGFKCDDFD
ncbi:MAG: hypothetical protein CMM91_09550 [Rickettsiales bacterium]|nr:hypothetical protein [Rickettsiales bacterium]OUV53280.1 MAG: hypothetical protein CBC87_05265 [Rickettsiales bacterium TMED127]